MELVSWRQLSGGGPDLVPCLDFPGARAAACFADLAAGVPAGARAITVGTGHDDFPKHYTFVDQVPRTPAGKIQRWRLAPFHKKGETPL